MKDAYAYKAQVGVDDSGALLFVKWVCPYCENEVSNSYFFSDPSDVVDGFEAKCTCPACGKNAWVYNSNPDRLY